MAQSKQFNPIHTAKKVEELYREYIATTIHFDDSGLQKQLEDILAKPRFLAKGPYLESVPPYRPAASVSDLVDQGILCEGMLHLGGFDPDRPLYVHQERAIRKAQENRNYAVVTGTGSGKTECFLLPVINDILSEFEKFGPSSGVRAMILYPMNALANDQLKRLRTLLAGTDITFGRYTGDTKTSPEDALKKWKSENPWKKKLPNEIISRKEIRENPPNILLTNYSMLEYLLLRPEDTSLFGSVLGAKWRHIAIDEAHIYSGSLGTEIAYLIRRLKARIASEIGEMPKLHCYATSATIGSDEDIPNVAKFAEGLFGEPFSSNLEDLDVITSERDSPIDALEEKPWGALPLDAWIELRAFVGRKSPEEKRNLREKLSGWVPETELGSFDSCEQLTLALGKILLGEESTAALVRRMSKDLLDLTNIEAMKDIKIDGLDGNKSDIEILSAMVEVLSWAQRSEDVPILTSRYHSFLRAPEGIFLNLRDRRLIEHKATSEVSEEGYAIPVYETSVCRHCGQAYILGEENSCSEGNAASWLNPKHEGIDADDEFIPRKYYRIIPQGEAPDPEETIQWICPTCGSLSSDEGSIAHRFEHEPCESLQIAYNFASEDNAKCNHCGYTSRVAIQPMRVSPEAAGSVVCYDLVRDIPSFKIENEDKPKSRFSKVEQKHGGNVICFSDKRQDAAFFAPAMERTYKSITVRQLIREAVDARSSEGKGCSPTQVCNWMAEIGSKRYPGFMEQGAADDEARAWMLDELTAEDSRNSLEGLGVVRIEPTVFNEGLCNSEVEDWINEIVFDLKNSCPWITADDFKIFAKVSLDTLREQGAIEVPVGVDKYRANHMARANDVVFGGELAEKGDIKFVGTADNKRSGFIRKYVRKVHEVEIDLEESKQILRYLYDFMKEYLMDFPDLEGYLIGSPERFQLNKDLWRLYPHNDDDVVFRCDTCGCESHIDTNGVCTTYKCDGNLVRTTYIQAKSKDQFYKDIYCEEALPIQIEEHTAQLTSERARNVQSSFIAGDVNVLSCTTTFELGVDVGDLRAIFMRNVPPTTANYTQRAGRVGRRAGKPGYALTFCRLRPHDITHFEDPRKIILGDTRVPFCYMENSEIAIRHVFAVAMSEFFRYMLATQDKDYARSYNDFMALAKDEPSGLIELTSFLNNHPEKVLKQLESIFASDERLDKDWHISDWSWIEKLVGSEEGRLQRTHELKRFDYSRIEDALARSDNSYERSKLEKAKGALESESTIQTLAENGILPKYGFPTDIVELHLGELDHRENKEKLQLQRGLRQAISEYAPGSEIVAGGKLWMSTGIRKKTGQDLITRSYGKCKCGTFVWPINDFSNESECPVCHSTIKLKNKMLIPSHGFEGVSVRKGIGLRKPRAKGYTKIYFSQHSLKEVTPTLYSFAGGSVLAKYSGNGQLCVINDNNEAGFQICNYCGASAGSANNVNHTDYCKKSNPVPKCSPIEALGTAFVSDVLELVLSIDNQPTVDKDDWESAMWAIFTAAAKLLDVPQSELGGTHYANDQGSRSLLIYDDVPGGAGHAKQLSRMVDELLKEAYEIVAHCTCSEDTCCYGCISNYNNQSKQAKLSRGAAAAIFGALLNSPTGSAASCEDQRTLRLTAHFDGPSLAAEGFAAACMYAKRLCITDAEYDFIDRLAKLGAKMVQETPQVEVTFTSDDGGEADCMLAWEKAHVAILGQANIDEFNESFGEFDGISDWRLFTAGVDNPNEALAYLGGN